MIKRSWRKCVYEYSYKCLDCCDYNADKGCCSAFMGHTFPSDADKTKVYICGPITGISDYKERFDKADLLLKNKGYCPINPVKLGNGDTDPNQWQGNMKTAIVGMLQADAIYLLGGWSASKGAVIEFNLANQLGYTFLNKDGSING